MSGYGENINAEEKKLNLAADAQFANENTVATDVCVAEVRQNAFAAADHQEEPATRMVVMFVFAQMLRQLGDTRGQQGDLHFRRSGVAFMGCVANDHTGFVIFLQRHCLYIPPLSYGRHILAQASD